MAIRKTDTKLVVEEPGTNVGEIKMALGGQRSVVDYPDAGQITKSGTQGNVPLPDYKVDWVQSELAARDTQPTEIPKIGADKLKKRLQSGDTSGVPQFYKSITQPTDELDMADVTKVGRGIELPSGETIAKTPGYEADYSDNPSGGSKQKETTKKSGGLDLPGLPDVGMVGMLALAGLAVAVLIGGD